MTDEEKEALRKFFATKAGWKRHIKAVLEETRRIGEEIEANRFPARSFTTLVGDLPNWRAAGELIAQRDTLERLSKIRGKRAYRRLKAQLEKQL